MIEKIAGDRPDGWPPRRTAWIAAVILMLANTLAFVDRQALALLVEPIKRDFGVSDTSMSLLYGLSFTLFYVLLGIPIARLADRANRRNIVAVSVFAWSAATALCGAVRSFPLLFAARIGVGAGEAGLGPAAYSILSDYFPAKRLAAAIGVYQMGTYLGGALALVLGGLMAAVIPTDALVTVPMIGAVKGWQLVFLGLGIPGLLLGLAMLLIREPMRRGLGEHGGQVVPLRHFVAHIMARRRAYLGIGIGFALMILVGNGTGAWIPAFFQRRFDWTTAEIGVRYGAVVFVFGTSGAFFGGHFASWLSSRGHPRGNLGAALLGFSALIPLTIAFPLVPNPWIALGLIAGMNFFAGFNFGGGLAALQEMTPNRMRALVASAYMLLINLIGGTLGPMAVALLTDHWFADPQRLPEAISITCAIASPLALLCLIIGMAGHRATMAVVAAPAP
ncbi:spinster family MFS transporter [Sphingomonas hylomeconis]|uniref:Spinster family MFS transporter n=2 Tax=Sphingomonas hylomeconis TaxID=1395958 RepID=A0ABV7SY70_9SPHN